MVDVSKYEDALREIERNIEAQARSICSEPNGGQSFSALNRACEAIQDAIHTAYKMRFTTEEV